MTYSSRHDLDISWAGDLGDEGDQPRQRHSGMEREVESFDPSKVLAELGPRGAMADAPAMVAAFDSLGERPSWHEAATPEPVALAWSAVLEAIDAATEAERDERALGGQEAAAQRVEGARVRAAVAAGKSVKASPAPDWSGQRRHLASIAAGFRERARRLRTEYEAIVVKQRPTWGARIIEDLPNGKAAVLAALATAGDHVERLLADASAAQAMILEPGGSVVSLPTIEVSRFVQAAQALAELVEASDQLAGVNLCHPAMEPTWAQRQQIAAALLHGVVDSRVHWLAALERREGYRRTSFTAGVPLPKPPEPTW